MAKTMPPSGWRRERFAAARKVLVDEGHIRARGPALPRMPGAAPPRTSPNWKESLHDAPGCITRGEAEAPWARGIRAEAAGAAVGAYGLSEHL
jgi:hypothetical protein